MESVDKTIEVLCGWIQTELTQDNTVEKDILTEMIKALAELVKARAQMCNTFHHLQGYSHALCNNSKVQ